MRWSLWGGHASAGGKAAGGKVRLRVQKLWMTRGSVDQVAKASSGTVGDYRLVPFGRYQGVAATIQGGRGIAKLLRIRLVYTGKARIILGCSDSVYDPKSALSASHEAVCPDGLEPTTFGSEEPSLPALWRESR
jgi:hypothetical protein